VVGKNPALGKPALRAGGVKARSVGQTLGYVMFELGKLHQQPIQTDLCRPNALIRGLNPYIETPNH
jgi:hypothetical protein